MEAEKRTVRWWPLLSVLVLTAGALAWTRLSADIIGQQRFVRSVLILFVALVLTLVWLVALSRLPPRVRWGALLAVVGLGVLLAFGLEIRGVSGNLVPIVTWRWASGESPRDPLSASGTVVSRVPGDFLQFLGSNRDGTVRGVHLAEDWQVEPPQELWRRRVGAGWSGFAVSGDLAVTMEQQGEEEQVVAYELGTGGLVWLHADKARYESTIAGIGPRATPTISGDRVFSMGATGLLNALDLESGRLLWSRDVLAETNGVVPEWGKSCSPLVLDDLVVVSAGGGGGRSLVAYDVASGSEVWSGGSDRSGYSSPTLAYLGGRRQVVILNHASVVGHDPETGDVLWSYPWSAEQPNVAMPLVLPDESVLVSSGYGVGSELLSFGPAEGQTIEVESAWRSPRLKAKFANPVHHDGFVYGLDDGTLVCLDPESGERCWKKGRYGHGQVLLVGDHLLVTAENGDVIIVRPTPEKHIELGRFTALRGKTWNPPALAGDLLLVRNDKEAVCYRLPLAS